jgi:hypothetical protein
LYNKNLSNRINNECLRCSSKTLSKENLKQLISAKNASVTLSKQNEKDHTHTSEVWSHFSTFFVNNKKQDFIRFSIFCNNYVHSYFES